MAPGLVEVQPCAQEVSKGSKEDFSDAPQAFNKQAEERGTATQPAATHPKYLPVWDADTK